MRLLAVDVNFKNTLSILKSLINLLYRAPKSKMKLYNRFGGYFNYKKMIGGNKQMKQAAYKLPPAISYPDGLPIYFLTGEKFLHQTLFCIQSLVKLSKQQYHFILVDDGSFIDEISKFIIEKLPGASIILQEQININLANNLPADKFPVLHHKRKVYPHIKKLTDIHTIHSGTWKLVLDSDMLFWKNPVEIINWLQQPNQPIHMVDCDESYGYSNALMAQLTGADIPKLVNVGAIGLNSSSINWEEIEYWVTQLEAKEGTSYYLEQALTAMIIAKNRSIALDKIDYKVNPTIHDLDHSTNVLHHYVDLSKEIYFKKAWKLLI